MMVENPGRVNLGDVVSENAAHAVLISQEIGISGINKPEFANVQSK